MDIPPVVSCAGWPAVTFLAHVVTVTPTGTSCPEFHWPAVNSLLLSVRKWQSLAMKCQAGTVLHAHSNSSLPVNTVYHPSGHVWRGIFIITQSEADDHKVYLSAIGWKCFHLLWFPESGQRSTWKIHAIKKRLSSLNRVLLHSGQRDYYWFEPQWNTVLQLL